MVIPCGEASIEDSVAVTLEFGAFLLLKLGFLWSNGLMGLISASQCKCVSHSTGPLGHTVGPSGLPNLSGP